MPLGFSKKSKDKDEESARSSLFGGRSKSSKSSTSQANPYAVQPATPDPYAAKQPDAYVPKPTTLSQPPSYDGRAPSPLRNDKTPVPQGGYGGGPQPQRFGGQGNYGQQSGYGSNAYGNEPPQQSHYGPSGYGGLGRSNSQDTMSTDAGRNALFGDVAERQQRLATQQPPAGNDDSYSGDNGYSDPSGSGDYSGGASGGYGMTADRQLTEEEQEEEDVQASKNEIKYIKQQDIASTRNARRIAEQAEATGRETLARLGQQGDRIHNTERNLDMASNQNRLAEEKARELKTLNRSMFAVHVANPFTANSRERAANDIALDKHQRERATRDATRAEAYSSTARHQGFAKDMQGNPIRPSQNKASLANRSKYQFEADSEDDEMENEIDDNLDAIHRGAKTLNLLGKAMGQELDEQNKHIGRIINKTDKVDDQIALNRARLDRIR